MILCNSDFVGVAAGKSMQVVHVRGFCFVLFILKKMGLAGDFSVVLAYLHL